MDLKCFEDWWIWWLKSKRFDASRDWKMRRWLLNRCIQILLQKYNTRNELKMLFRIMKRTYIVRSVRYHWLRSSYQEIYVSIIICKNPQIVHHFKNCAFKCLAKLSLTRPKKTTKNPMNKVHLLNIKYHTQATLVELTLLNN